MSKPSQLRTPDTHVLRSGLLINYKGYLVFYPCSEESQLSFLDRGFQGEAMVKFSFEKGEYKLSIFGDINPPVGGSVSVTQHGLRMFERKGDEAVQIAAKILSLPTISKSTFWGRGDVIELQKLISP